MNIFFNTKDKHLQDILPLRRGWGEEGAKISVKILNYPPPSPLQRGKTPE